MTNPSNIVRTRARISGRASVYEANSWCQPFSVGLLDGNGVLENTSPNMNVLVGGSSSTKPDTIIASTPSGYKIALDIVGQQAVAITAPASNSRITCIVAYTNDLSVASTDTAVTGNPSSCGLIVVNGTSGASPVAPDDTAIRAAITADGATGSQAAYCIIAKMTIASTTTAITNSLITITTSTLSMARIADLSIATAKIAANAITAAKLEAQQAWVTPTLAAGWSAYDTLGATGYGTLQYFKDSLGIVHLKGLIKNTSGSTKASPSTITTLPAGYRPANLMRFTTNMNDAISAVDVGNDGLIQNSGANGSVPSNGWINFNGITFRAEA